MNQVWSTTWGVVPDGTASKLSSAALPKSVNYTYILLINSFYFVFISFHFHLFSFEMGPHYVSQAGLELRSSSDPPTSAS
jgi:hypothetical protein